MARLADNLKYRLGRLGRLGLAGALLVAIALGYDAAVLRPRLAQLDKQLQRNEQLRREAAELRAREPEPSAAATEGPTLAPGAAAALRRLFDAADQAGLDLDRGEYRLSEAREAHLRIYQISLPVYGGYPEIRAFMAQALNGDPALALSSVQMHRDSIESADLEGMLNFTVYLEPGA